MDVGVGFGISEILSSEGFLEATYQVWQKKTRLGGHRCLCVPVCLLFMWRFLLGGARRDSYMYYLDPLGKPTMEGKPTPKIADSTPKKLAWQWKITIFNNRGYIFKCSFFHCHAIWGGLFHLERHPDKGSSLTQNPGVLFFFSIWIPTLLLLL